jgi:uridine kinase
MTPHARAVLELALSRPATLGEGRLVCVDGPAGSGKTTLATALFDAFPGSRVVHMDDLYDGWSGLPRVGAQLGSLLRPLSEGRAGTYRRYDWHSGRFAETVTVDPVELLVLEGVGSGARAHADLVTVLVWMSAPPDLRLDRGLARDGAAMEARLRQWMVDEADHFARESTRERADLVMED